VRILVDQSRYDLMNLGDVAKMQACVARLRLQTWRRPVPPASG
jgi:hypothetical protein